MANSGTPAPRSHGTASTMSEAEPQSGGSSEALVLEGHLEETERYQPRWTVLLRPVQTFVGLLPSHKNTRKGRRTAKQVKLVVAVLAFVAVIAAQSTIVMILGLIGLGVSPVVPISQVRKRSWINRLKSIREGRDRTVERSAQVTCDDHRVSLVRDDDRLRRVLVDRDDHEISVGTAADRLFLKIAPTGGNKSETIWIGTDDLEIDDVPDDWSTETFSSDQLDRPIVVRGSEWRELAEHLL